MLEARRRAEWERAAWICHVIVNSNPWRTGPPALPAECNPLRPESAAEIHVGIDCTNPGAVRSYHAALLAREAHRRGKP
jgi:hypothetical protein